MRILLTLSFVFISSVVYAGGSAGQYATTTMTTAGGLVALNSLTSEKLFSKCACPATCAFCILGGAALVQAQVDASAGKKALDTKKGFDTGGFDGPGFDDTDPTNNGGGGGPDGLGIYAPIVKDGLDMLKKNGIKFNKDGSFDVKGKKYPASTLSSMQAAIDAGIITPEQAEEANKIMKDVKDKFKVSSVGIAGGGGGGGGGAGKTKITYDDPYGSMYGMGEDKEKARDPKTAGLTRNLASGESIGSQSDNIFEMIRRRYEKKAEENIFVGQ